MSLGTAGFVKAAVGEVGKVLRVAYYIMLRLRSYLICPWFEVVCAVIVAALAVGGRRN